MRWIVLLVVPIVLPSGLLRLNVPRVALPCLIEPILADFCASYPEVQVEIHVDDRLANIVAEGFGLV